MIALRPWQRHQFARLVNPPYAARPRSIARFYNRRKFEIDWPRIRGTNAHAAGHRDTVHRQVLRQLVFIGRQLDRLPCAVQ